ncbi:CHAP domain-containing protein [Candidatus Saccharibacteria bacterium]|nr:CHAP domain-containing protein [Candidatus Saccharibacteria bacterium]
MRASVLTGMFACVLIFGTHTAKTSAQTPEVLTNSEQTSVIELLSVETETVLEVIDEIVLDETSQPANSQETKQVSYIIEEGDNLSKVAAKYETTWQRLFFKNTQLEDPNILVVGAELVIPTKDEELTERELPEVIIQPVTSAANSSSAAASQVTVARGSSSGNGYVAGYCTWYVKNKRPDLPNNLGNAATWVSRAAAQGLPTGSTPAVGAVGQRGNHVVYVESVNVDGTVTISEMNHKGLYVMTVRTLPASYFSYIY